MKINLQSINKPEYFFQVHKYFLFLYKNWFSGNYAYTSWNQKMKVNKQETIGRSISKMGLYDLAIVEVAWRLIKKNDTVIDAGANIGFMSLLFSFLVKGSGKVYCFEPNYKILPSLKENLAIAKFNNTYLQEYALSEGSGELKMFISDNFKTNEGIGKITYSQEEEGELFVVKSTTLDSFLRDTNDLISLMKIDVEGHELELLKGAESVLSKKQIVNIIFECDDKSSKVFEILEYHGYEIFRIEKGFIRVRLADRFSKSKIAPWESTNYLATIEADTVRKSISSPFYQSLL